MKKIFCLCLAIMASAIMFGQGSGAGSLHNELLNRLYKGEFKDSRTFKGYIDNMSIAVTGNPQDISQSTYDLIAGSMYSNDPLLSISSLNNNKIINSNLKTVLDEIYTYFRKYEHSEEELSTDDFNAQLDGLIRTLNISGENREKVNAIADVARHSYLLQVELDANDLANITKQNSTKGGPNFYDNSLGRCKGFWRKFCIVIFDIIGGAIGAAICAINPPGCVFTIPFFAALYSYASSCCGVCCPRTQFCWDSGVCCVTFGGNCPSAP